MQLTLDLRKNMKTQKLTDSQSKRVVDNLDLVWFSIHKSHLSNYKDLEDLFQEGCIYLILSSQRFDESRGVAFSTYAVPMITLGIKRFIRENTYVSGMKAPRRSLDIRKKYLNQESLTKTEEKILEELNSRMTNSINLDDTYDESGDSVGDTSLGLLDTDLLRLEDQSLIDEILSRLKEESAPRDYEIYEEDIYGRLYDVKESQYSMAKKYGVSQPTVVRVLKSMRKKADEIYLSILRREY